jgi:hypothetical protein
MIAKVLAALIILTMIGSVAYVIRAFRFACLGDRHRRNGALIAQCGAWRNVCAT